MILGYWLLNKRCEYQLHQYLYPVMRGSSHDVRIYALPEELFIWNRNRSQKIGKWKRDRRYNTTADLVEAQIGYSKFPFFCWQQNGQWILMNKTGQLEKRHI